MGSTKTKTKTSTNSSQTNAPPTWTAPGLSDVAARVTAGVGQIPTSHYNGPQVASMSPQDLAAIQAAWQGTAANAGGLADWLQGQTMQEYDFQSQLPTESFTMAPRQNLDGVISAAIDPVRRTLTESILPGLQSSALDAGAYSGDRAMRVLPGQAIDNATESMQRIAAQLGYEDYQNYENRRLAAWEGDQNRMLAGYGAETDRAGLDLQRLGLMPDMVNSILRTQASEGDLLRMAAELGISTEQAQINDALARDQYASQAPFMGLDTASALLAALSGNWGTQTGKSDSTQTTKQTQSPVMQGLQAAIGLGSMAAGFPGLGAALGGAGGMGAAATSLPSAASVFSRVAQLPSFMGPGQ